jgi:hypothetical protein
LSAGPTPHIPLNRWEFTIRDENNALLLRWDWKSFRALPTESPTVDLHCVTRWSKLGTTWEGVSLDMLLTGLNTDASFVMAHSYGDYTTNIPLGELKNGKACIAFRFDAKDLATEHGGPARLLVPHLYLWKSAKGCEVFSSCGRRSLVSGKASAITFMEIHGGSSDTRMDLLAPTDTISGCAYKGFAQYWLVDASGTTVKDLTWSYKTSLPENLKIAGLIAFYSTGTPLPASINTCATG